jgi:molecular chaperone HscC
VLDLGGGTFDVSILEVFDGVMKVHASAGDNRLGGDDFVEMLLDRCTAQLGLSKENAQSGELAQRVAAMERIKLQLSSGQTGQASFLAGGVPRDWSITEDEFARLVDPLLQRIRRPLRAQPPGDHPHCSQNQGGAHQVAGVDHAPPQATIQGGTGGHRHAQ